MPKTCGRSSKPQAAARAALGIGRVGGVGEYWSGDLAVAFATGNTDLGARRSPPAPHAGPHLGMADPYTLTALYQAAVDATEEVIVNALFAAETMTGRDGITAHELPVERIAELMVAGRVS